MFQAFFNTPDIIDEQTNDTTIGIINKDHNEVDFIYLFIFFNI